MSPSSSQDFPAGKDPPDPLIGPISSPHLPYASLQAPSQSELLPEVPNTSNRQQAFTPFFTLIDDSTTATTHHPTNVHYIFSDDDQDSLTAACLSAIPSSTSPPHSQSSSAHQSLPSQSRSSSTSISSKSASKNKRRSETAREHRALLIDLDETGTSIKSAHSLSSSWQILSTSLTPAPTWDSSHPADKEAVPASSMLRIEGTDGSEKKRDVSGGMRSNEEEITAPDSQALMDDFDRRMRLLRTIVEAGNKRLGMDTGAHEGDGLEINDIQRQGKEQESKEEPTE